MERPGHVYACRVFAATVVLVELTFVDVVASMTFEVLISTPANACDVSTVGFADPVLAYSRGTDPFIVRRLNQSTRTQLRFLDIAAQHLVFI
jgi:hypothetical protein